METIACVRPSVHELNKKIAAARVALEEQDGFFARPLKAMGELNALDIVDAKEVWGLIRLLLDEMSMEDYVGGNPPQRAYEKAIEQVELFAFCWWSETMETKMYLKFALKKGRYYYVSLHPSRYGQGEGGGVK